MASTSNIPILERFQSKSLRKVVEASWLLLSSIQWIQWIRLMEEISIYKQLKKESAATALNTVLASLHTKTTY
jgi:hypothetical protein